MSFLAIKEYNHACSIPTKGQRYTVESNQGWERRKARATVKSRIVVEVVEQKVHFNSLLQK